MWRKIGGKRARKVTERKMGNMDLLEACKVMHVSAGRGRKVTERKIHNTHLLESWENTVKHDGKKGAKRREKAGESDGKKDEQYAFIRSRQGWL
jgi:hypothetical protein